MVDINTIEPGEIVNYEVEHNSHKWANGDYIVHEVKNGRILAYKPGTGPENCQSFHPDTLIKVAGKGVIGHQLPDMNFSSKKLMEIVLAYNQDWMNMNPSERLKALDRGNEQYFIKWLLKYNKTRTKFKIKGAKLRENRRTGIVDQLDVTFEDGLEINGVSIGYQDEYKFHDVSSYEIPLTGEYIYFPHLKHFVSASDIIEEHKKEVEQFLKDLNK